jgi:glycerol kinase
MLTEVHQSKGVLLKQLQLFFNKNSIARVAGDQQAALFGQLCTKPGMAKKHLWNRLFYVDEYKTGVF